MKYEHFEMLLETWQGFQKAVHTLPPSHPMKKYYKSVFTKIRMLPSEKQEEYFDMYYKKSS